MTKKFNVIFKAAAASALCAGLLASTVPALAATATSVNVSAPAAESALLPPQTLAGHWSVTNLALETSARQIESYKVSRDFVAWTELDPAVRLRRLYAFDGVNIRLLATMPQSEWESDAGNGFFDPISGNYDLADGLLVWTATDGLDREIWSFDGFSLKQVSSNTYDDNHPVTAAGRVAWTSYPGSAYNLMVSDRRGVRRLDGWQVKNYAFSGQNLYWLNRLPNEDWFRVFVDNGGLETKIAVGKGDDRPLVKYFYTDGKGTAAWEYSTKRWDYDKREIFLSYQGSTARRLIQRDVPPNVTRIEDVDGRWVILNVTNLLQSSIWERVSLIKTDGGREIYLDRYTSPMRIRTVGDGLYVRHLVADASSALTLGAGTDNVNFIKNEHVILDRFEAKDGVVAGALLKGGLLLRNEEEVVTVPSTGIVQSLAVNGCVAWLEGTDAVTGRLRSACPTVAVRNTANGVSRVAGRLVKSTGSNPNVYLAAADGQRYLIPSEAQFFGWYGDFKSLRKVSDKDLNAIHLAGSVLMRPGYRPVKAASAASVYAVADDGLLRWVTSADLMRQMYGSDWQKKVAVIPDAAIGDYRLGAPIAVSLLPGQVAVR